jgi:hypothetical protein
LVVYYSSDIKRFQPFSYQNNIIKYRVDQLAIDLVSGKFILPLNSFTSQTSLSFSVIEPNTNIELFSVTDGYIVANGNTAILGSLSTNFSSIPDISNKKIKIYGTDNFNNGLFDVVSYSVTNNTFLINNYFNKIDYNQISVIRLLDGQEIWNSSGTIDVTNNQILLPTNSNLAVTDKVFVMIFNYSNLRQSLPRLSSNIVDQTNNTGTITVSGTTITKATNVVFTATNTGLKLNLSEALRKALSLSSTSSIPSNVKVVRIVKLEKVTTASSGSDEVVSILTTYDVKNTTINNNLFYTNELLSDTSLQNLDFILPSTQNNTLNGEVRNLPIIGDKLRVTFYYATTGDSENLAYTRNGLLYTNKKFGIIDKVFVNSGFRASQSTRISLVPFSQPNLGARYKAYYDYLAPKPNERISITYNFNKIISDTTFTIENTRPINADVLVRAAKKIQIDLTMNVVITESYLSSTNTVLQNLRDKLNTALNSTNLGAVIDQTTLINIAQGVSGVARARIVYFNKTGNVGQVLTIKAQQDEYFISNNLIINTETR